MPLASDAGAVGPAWGQAVWPRRLVAAYVEPDGLRVVCGFDGGFCASVPLTALGIKRRPRVVVATPDEFGRGLILLREDGTVEDCGADIVLEVAAGRAVPDGGRAEDDDLGSRVADRIRSAREESGLTQRALAERVGMAPSNYNRLEKGRHVPSMDSLVRLAEALSIPLSRLVGR